MNGNTLIGLMIPILLVSGINIAQEPLNFDDLAEEFLYRDGSDILPMGFLEEKLELGLQGIDLNSAGRDELIASGLFTPFQAQMLIDYREQYGRLWTVYELVSLPGFRHSRVERMIPFLSASTDMSSPKPQANGGRLMIDAVRNFPNSRGHSTSGLSAEEPLFTGSPWKTSTRFSAPSGQGFSLAAAYEKDAGESFHYSGKPEFLSGHLSFKRKGVVREIVAGSFRLNHGLGLVNGSGFMHSPEILQVNRSSFSRIRPGASLSSTGTCTGLAARMETQKLRILAWSSYMEHDLSPDAVMNGAHPFESRRETGLHRTPGEIEGRALGYRFHSGVQVLTWQRGFTMGALMATGQTGLTRRGMDTKGSSSPPLVFRTGSIHMLWQKRSLEIFGEVACRELNNPAVLIGLRYNFSDFLQGQMLLHHYAPGYRGINPSAYASGSKVENESGFALSLHAEPGRILVADFSCEYFLYPAPRYLTDVPSWGSRIGLTLQGPGRGSLLWKIRLLGRTWQNTPHREGLNHRPVVTYNRIRAEFRLDHHPFPAVSWQSRLVFSNLEKTGFAAAQQIRFTAKSSVFTLQFTVFRVDEWENRIYLYEPGPLYSFSFPALCGRGQKIAGLCTLKPMDRLNLSFKMSHLTYFDRDYIGSGNDLTEGNRRLQIHLQARLRF